MKIINLEDNEFLDQELFNNPSISSHEVSIWGVQPIKSKLWVHRETKKFVDPAKIHRLNEAFATYQREFISILNGLNSTHRTSLAETKNHEILMKDLKYKKEVESYSVEISNKYRTVMNSKERIFNEKDAEVKKTINSLNIRRKKLSETIVQLKKEISNYILVDAEIPGFPDFGDRTEFDPRRHFVNVSYLDHDGDVSTIRNTKLGKIYLNGEK